MQKYSISRFCLKKKKNLENVLDLTFAFRKSDVQYQRTNHEKAGKIYSTVNLFIQISTYFDLPRKKKERQGYA